MATDGVTVDPSKVSWVGPRAWNGGGDVAFHPGEGSARAIELGPLGDVDVGGLLNCMYAKDGCNAMVGRV
jgi:hypothetical protein